jgi:SAM-dependent methyltransferase
MVATKSKKKLKLTKKLTCPACSGTDTQVFRTGVRENPKTPVYICMRCALRFIEPSFKDVRTYYRDQYRSTHDYTPGNEQTPEERWLMMYPLMNERARFFKDHVPVGGSVLEIGCSSGFFLGAIKDDYDVYGAEWNPEDAAYVRDVGGIPCEEGDIDDIYPGKQFSAIAAYHVLEHQPDPVGWLKKLHGRLIGGGHLMIEVPNSEEALLTLYDIPEFRDFWYREPHICYFNLPNLVNTLHQADFEVRGHTHQRYSLMNHMNWMWNRRPMPDPMDAQSFYHPVHPKHPAAGVMNRLFEKLDKEYRLTLDTYKAGDTLRAHGRKIEI